VIKGIGKAHLLSQNWMLTEICTTNIIVNIVVLANIIESEDCYLYGYKYASWKETEAHPQVLSLVPVVMDCQLIVKDFF